MLSGMLSKAESRAISPRKHAVHARTACFRGVTARHEVPSGSPKAWHPPNYFPPTLLTLTRTRREWAELCDLALGPGYDGRAVETCSPPGTARASPLQRTVTAIPDRR